MTGVQTCALPISVELSIPCITAVDTAASLVDCLRSEHSLANIPLVDIATLYRGK